MLADLAIVYRRDDLRTTQLLPLGVALLALAPARDGSSRRWPALPVALVSGAHPGALEDYGRRERTRRDHFFLVQAHLGFRRATEEDLRLLTAWLATAALEHDRPTRLLQMACERLHRDKILRPGLTRLEKIVANAGSRAGEETFSATPDSASTRPAAAWARPGGS